MRSIVRRKRKIDSPNTTSQSDSGISDRPTRVIGSMIDMSDPMQGMRRLMNDTSGVPMPMIQADMQSRETSVFICYTSMPT
jgi:hypothetical protein